MNQQENLNRQETPPLAIEDRVMDAQRKGFDVVASIRGFRVALSPLIYFYIDVTAVDKSKKGQEIDLGFWPGMTNELAEAETALAEIKEKNPKVQIVHSKDPVFLCRLHNPHPA